MSHILKKKQYLSKFFKVPLKDIGDSHVQYFYTNDKRMCCNFNNLKPFFDNIEPYE